MAAATASGTRQRQQPLTAGLGGRPSVRPFSFERALSETRSGGYGLLQWLLLVLCSFC